MGPTGRNHCHHVWSGLYDKDILLSPVSMLDFKNYMRQWICRHMTVTGQYVLGPEFRPKLCLHVSQTSVGQLHCSLRQNSRLPVCIFFYITTIM